MDLTEPAYEQVRKYLCDRIAARSETVKHASITDAAIHLWSV